MDLEGGTRASVAIVNRTMAQRLWPGQDPVGCRFRLGSDACGEWFTVIGTARDIANEDIEDGRPHAQRIRAVSLHADPQYVPAGRATSVDPMVALRS